MEQMTPKKTPDISILEQACKNKEFIPYVQPIVASRTYEIAGFEVLLRWHLTDGQILLPSYFIPVLETSGLLPSVSRNMMINVFNALDNIPDGFRISVNITPSLLADKEFIRICLLIAQSSRVKLVLELIESSSFLPQKNELMAIERLDNVGVEFALDDFGIGCSVLAYLKYFPVSILKIDGFFTQDIHQDTTSYYIIESIISLAQKLHIRTVAERVETKQQAKILEQLGVDYLQGYCFGRPESLKSFKQNLKC